MVQNVSSEWWFHKETTGCIKKNKAGHTGKRGFHRFLDAEDRNNRVCYDYDSDPFENTWALCSFHVGRLHIGCPKIDCPPVFQSLSFPQPIGWSLENCNMREESREMVQSQQSLRSRETWMRTVCTPTLMCASSKHSKIELTRSYKQLPRVICTDRNSAFQFGQFLGSILVPGCFPKLGLGYIAPFTTGFPINWMRLFVIFPSYLHCVLPSWVRFIPSLLGTPI